MSRIVITGQIPLQCMNIFFIGIPAGQKQVPSCSVRPSNLVGNLIFCETLLISTIKVNDKFYFNSGF